MKLKFLIFLLPLFFSCNKEKEIVNINLPQNFKDYFFFHSNSYWKYKTSLGTNDSLFILQEPKIFYYLDEIAHKNYETVYIFYQGGPFKSMFLNASSAKLTTNYLHNVTILENRIILNQLHNIYPDQTLLYTHYDTINISNKIYNNVLRSTLTKYYHNDTLSWDFYLVPHIGIIKYKSIKNNIDTTWLLFDYHLANGNTSKY